MKEFNDFTKFKILSDDVGILCVESNYGMTAIAEIENNIFYLGAIKDHRLSGELNCEDDSPNVYLAMLAWKKYFNESLSERDEELILKDNGVIKK